MQIIEQILTVGEGGRVALQVSRPVGVRVRVIVLDETGKALDESTALPRWQEDSGFARQALANPAEDVWNDL